MDLSEILKEEITKEHGYKRDFQDFQDNIKLALFDMMYNIGAKQFPDNWKHGEFGKALKEEKWSNVAELSNRTNVGPNRNTFVKGLFEKGVENDRTRPLAPPSKIPLASKSQG